jgi:hypothetical protein
VVLVDTSIWIAVFARERPLALEQHVSIDEVVTRLPVIQEVLQGFRNDRAHARARSAMLAFQCLEPTLEVAHFEAAADLYRRARRAGVTVRSSVDCLIAAIAIRHRMPVLHRDRDFARLASVSDLEQRACGNARGWGVRRLLSRLP